MWCVVYEIPVLYNGIIIQNRTVQTPSTPTIDAPPAAYNSWSRWLQSDYHRSRRVVIYTISDDSRRLLAVRLLLSVCFLLFLFLPLAVDCGIRHYMLWVLQIRFCSDSGATAGPLPPAEWDWPRSSRYKQRRTPWTDSTIAAQCLRADVVETRPRGVDSTEGADVSRPEVTGGQMSFDADGLYYGRRVFIWSEVISELREPCTPRYARCHWYGGWRNINKAVRTYNSVTAYTLTLGGQSELSVYIYVLAATSLLIPWTARSGSD